jgi:CheY-like chemotaxis protein
MKRKGSLKLRLYDKKIDSAMKCETGEIAPGDYTVFEVADTGCGMDPVTLSKAFQPFFTTKAVGEGTGMGLSVVLGVVKSHDGEIQVETTLGMGTTIRIFLPAIEDSILGGDIDEVQISILGAERILIVDDEQMLIEMNKDWLTSLGYTVTAVTSSRDAMRILKEKSETIDILITDQTMPDITGIELAKEALRIRKGLPIILCTGYSNEVNPDQAAAIGINKFIMKPYRSYELGKAIREVLDNKKNGDIG